LPLRQYASWHDLHLSSLSLCSEGVASEAFIIRRSRIPLLEQYLLRYKHFLSFKYTHKQTGLDSHYLLLPFKMQLSILFLTFARTLLSLISGKACVAGGPADQVTAANTCCKKLTGTWFVSILPLSLPLLPFRPPFLLLHIPFAPVSRAQAYPARRCDTKANQGICVLLNSATFWWEFCALEIPGGMGLLDMSCIPGDGERI
jgi:hypothetical protein